KLTSFDACRWPPAAYGPDGVKAVADRWGAAMPLNKRCGHSKQRQDGGPGSVRGESPHDGDQPAKIVGKRLHTVGEQFDAFGAERSRASRLLDACSEFLGRDSYQEVPE